MKYTNIDDANARIVEIEAENTTLTAEINTLRKDKERLNEQIKRKDADIKELREALGTTTKQPDKKPDRIDFKTIRK